MHKVKIIHLDWYKEQSPCIEMQLHVYNKLVKNMVYIHIDKFEC